MAPALISLTGITKTYATGDVDFPALRGIDLEIADGEFVAIMGPSGSGKSTTMHIIGALDTPTSGTYRLGGKDISKLDEDQLAEIRNHDIGFVFQSFNLLPRTTVQKNVERPMMYAGVTAAERRSKANQALKLVGLEDKAGNLSNQLSGGQIQRVAIARSLVMTPKLILADEPTGNLDTQTALHIMEFFRALNERGHTIVLITHEEDIAAFAQRRVKLKDGLIVSDSGEFYDHAH
ncbi:MAG: ABC transporter ATP-binding protein [Actinomycetota bacterium]|nr:ABC transporter ATP-binding protein [Actinomycetota bacterium]